MDYSLPLQNPQNTLRVQNDRFQGWENSIGIIACSFRGRYISSKFLIPNRKEAKKYMD